MILSRTAASILCLCLLIYCPRSSNQEGELKATGFLKQFGYIDDTPGSSSLLTEEAYTKALKDFQAFVGLPATGELDDDTVEIMKMPRCGLKDKTANSKKRRKRFVLQGTKWPKNELTYWISDYSAKLSRQEVEEAMRKAFGYWSNVTPLTFKKKSGKVDIDIRFAAGDHGDDPPFDGPGNTLAHAFFPNFGGDAHFDETEDWTMSASRGQNLIQVATHEFGHSLGLEHSDVKASVMFPYVHYKEPFNLHRDDVRGIQALYGTNQDTPKPQPPKPEPPKPEPPKPEPPRTPERDSNLCKDASMDLIFKSRDGEVYVFKGSNYWKLDGTRLAAGYPKSISDTWKGLPSNLDAAFTHVKNKRTYFFKGSQYWRFTGTEMEGGYPKPISETFPGVPNNLDGAMVWAYNGKVYFFKGPNFWAFNHKESPPVKNTYPKPISNWKGLPNNIDATFTHDNGYTYFFKGDSFYRINNRKASVDIADPPYPRSTARFWFGC